MDMLTGYIVAAMMSWVPISNHATYETAEETMNRYVDIATTISTVAMDPEKEPLYAGDDGRLRTALLLASVASSESHFRKSVDTCQISGDKGLAWGLWQTHASKDRVCNDRVEAATIALKMMRYSISHCKNYNVLDRLSIYTRGRCRSNAKHSRLKMTRAHNWYEVSIVKPRAAQEKLNEQHSIEHTRED